MLHAKVNIKMTLAEREIVRQTVIAKNTTITNLIREGLGLPLSKVKTKAENGR